MSSSEISSDLAEINGTQAQQGAEKWQQVLWTDESLFEISGCRRRLFFCLDSSTIISVCKQQWSMMEVPCNFMACISANAVGDFSTSNSGADRCWFFAELSLDLIKRRAPTPAGVMAPQPITDTSSLDSVLLYSSSDILDFQIKCKIWSGKRTLDPWATAHFFLSSAQWSSSDFSGSGWLSKRTQQLQPMSCMSLSLVTLEALTPVVVHSLFFLNGVSPPQSCLIKITVTTVTCGPNFFVECAWIQPLENRVLTIASVILWPTEPAWDQLKAQETLAGAELLSLLKYHGYRAFL